LTRKSPRHSSCDELAPELLDECLAGREIDQATLRRLTADECGAALFRVVAEGLSDRFEPRLVGRYIEVFSRAIALVRPGVSAASLAARYRRIAKPRVLSSSPRGAFVLSRVTVGADVAITSVVLDALARRLPGVPLLLVGDARLKELFGADPRIQYEPFDYPRRATVRECVDASYRLAKVVSRPGWIVVDPDSRLTQLGLVPVCDEKSYFFFPSRSCGGDGDEPLGALVRSWVHTSFGVADATSFVAPLLPAPEARDAAVAVSFGVGGNERKRVSAGFESGLVRGLVERDAFVSIDAGASAAEREQAARAASGLDSGRVRLHEGTIGSLASLVRGSALYVGYDSSGQHIAAALGVPFVTVFRGYASARVAARWRPLGAGPGHVIDAEAGPAALALARVLAAVDGLGVLPGRGAVACV
jgi:hypothetical protein